MPWYVFSLLENKVQLKLDNFIQKLFSSGMQCAQSSRGNETPIEFSRADYIEYTTFLSQVHPWQTAPHSGSSDPKQRRKHLQEEETLTGVRGQWSRWHLVGRWCFKHQFENTYCPWFNGTPLCTVDIISESIHFLACAGLNLPSATALTCCAGISRGGRAQIPTPTQTTRTGPSRPAARRAGPTRPAHREGRSEPGLTRGSLSGTGE